MSVRSASFRELTFAYSKGWNVGIVLRLFRYAKFYTNTRKDDCGQNILLDLDVRPAVIANYDAFESWDIPEMVERGERDFAIVEECWVVNNQSKVEIVGRLPITQWGIGTETMVLAVPSESGVRTIVELPTGSVVATEFLSIARSYLRQKSRSDIKVRRKQGLKNRQQKPWAGTADAVITIEGKDSPDCRTTQFAKHGLMAIDTICSYQLAIIANKKSLSNPVKGPAIRKATQYLEGCLTLMLEDIGPKEDFTAVEELSD